MRFTLLSFTVVLFFAPNCCNAQSWQWGSRGGAPIDNGPTSIYENVQDMTTDKWGNVYTVSQVYNYDINIGGETYSTSGPFAELQLCISSYTCEGALRWFKLIIADDENKAFSVKTDTLGGVYVAGNVYGSSGAHITIASTSHVDTTFSSANKTVFLVKFDTGGAYKWITMPEPDTLTIYSQQSGVLDMDVDPSGDSYMLCSLKPGAYAGSAFVATDTNGWNIWEHEGAYILKYDRKGVFQNAVHLPIRDAGAGSGSFFMKRDAVRSLNYISGISGSIAGDTTFISDTAASMFLACFDDYAHLKWMKYPTFNGVFGSVVNRAGIDDSGNVFLAGGCASGYIFAGHTFHSDYPYPSSIPFVMKFDPAGKLVWATNGSNKDLVSGCGVAICKDTVGVYGLYSTDKLAWGGDTVTQSGYYQLFMSRFNSATGAVIGIDTCTATGMCFPAGEMEGVESGNGSIATDRYGNFYVAGAFEESITFGPDKLINTGGATDWFVAKFGTANCTIPVDTGTTSVAIVGTTIAPPVKIYPNPATDAFVIENASGTVRIYNVMGVVVYEGEPTGDRQTIPVNYLPSGLYILHTTDKLHNPVAKTIVIKE